MKPKEAQPDLAAHQDGRVGVWKLAAAFATIVCLWCIVLPWYAGRPGMKQHLQFLDDRGIDPSAMFYTELDAMDAILEKLEGADQEAGKRSLLQ